MRPEQVGKAHAIGRSVMLDNGAFSRRECGAPTDWPRYYVWCDRRLAYPTAWAVIPDVIDANSHEQDALIREWPRGHRGAPVRHMDEPIHRLPRPTDEWSRVCVGPAAEYRDVLSTP